LVVAPLRGDDRPAAAPGTAPGEFEEAVRHPLTRDTWPIWRAIYLKMCFEDAADPERERWFYEQISAFFRATAAAAGGALPDEFASDPMAWVALSWSHLVRASERAGGGAEFDKDLAAAEAAARKAIALGDPQGNASYSLATALISPGLRPRPDQPRPTGLDQHLAEAEERLAHVERVAPRANLLLWRGYVAQLRGDAAGATTLFRRATEEHPASEFSAIAYLMNAIQSGQPAGGRRRPVRIDRLLQHSAVARTGPSVRQRLRRLPPALRAQRDDRAS
jgi:hypothetical protein